MDFSTSFFSTLESSAISPAFNGFPSFLRVDRTFSSVFMIQDFFSCVGVYVFKVTSKELM